MRQGRTIAIAVALLLWVSAAYAETSAGGDAAASQASPTSTNTSTNTGEAAPAAAPKQADPAEASAVTTPQAVVFDPALIRGHAVPWQLGFQPAASPVMEQFTWLHNLLLVVITVISVVVLALLAYVCLRFRAKSNPTPNKFSHNTLIEVIWTVIPILILVGIAIPSLRVHFQYSDNQTIIDNPDLTIKVLGHQWYWSYEYPDENIAFDSNMKKENELLTGEPRLLAVDKPIVVPVNKVVRVQLTSADVNHAFAMPAFGVKMDAVPGRLNETWFKATEEGIYYGQCSELCGKFHGFMPIEIRVVSDAQYQEWLNYAKKKYAASGDHIQLASLE
jgi:cytochrome c oxidase subunit 2